ncbi:hypothetical protein F5Y15DRAFT_182805 [Xylariaceae sp. FL0016]|nr:hypothetical protein F5Y15DRAFT_182805 [Xylariaceae sp. FL0016]
MDLASTTTRLRRTFAYPSDTTSPSPSSLSDDNDHDGPALDEQEQDDLIAALATQNATRNAQFRLFLLSLPLLSTLPYLITLFAVLFARDASSTTTNNNPAAGGGPRQHSRGHLADTYISVLSLTSLAATAWTLWSLPPGVTGIRILDAWTTGSGPSTSADPPHQSPNLTHDDDTLTLGPIGANAQRRRRRGSSLASSWSLRPSYTRSPLEQYLPTLNIGLCSVLVVTGYLSTRSAAAEHWGHVGLGNLPAVVYVVILVAKMVMGNVDPERELEGLRYEYKGA